MAAARVRSQYRAAAEASCQIAVCVWYGEDLEGFTEAEIEAAKDEVPMLRAHFEGHAGRLEK